MNKNLDSLILTILGQKVLLDADLAAIYRVETKRLNQQVKDQEYSGLSIIPSSFASLRLCASHKNFPAQRRKVFSVSEFHPPNAMTENEISRIVVDAAVKLHQDLGPGLLGSVYEVALAYLLMKRGLSCVRQLPIPINYDGLEFDEGFRADIVVNDLVILELKSVENIAQVHRKQLQTYLRLSDKKLGLLLNFGAPLMRDGIVRAVNNLPES